MADHKIGALQAHVGAWHRRVFGEHDPLDHARAIGQKAQEEARELHDDPTPEECADLAICALAAADRLGVDLGEEIVKKYAVLVARGADQLDRDRARGIVQAADLAATLRHHGIDVPKVNRG